MNTKQTIIDKYIEEFRKNHVDGHGPIQNGANDPTEPDSWIASTPEEMEQFLKSALQAVVVDTLDAVEKELECKNVVGNICFTPSEWSKLKSRLSIEKKKL